MTERHFNHGTIVPPKKKYEIDVDIDLPDEVILKLALMAHEQGITLNQLCINILKEKLDCNKCTHEVLESDIDGNYCTSCGDRVVIE